MARFALGFLTATVVYGIAFALYATGFFDAAPEIADEPLVAVADSEDAGANAQKRGRRRGRGAGASSSDARGGQTRDDDLSESGVRTLEMGAEGGEAQLPASAIERVFDDNMRRIRQCLALVEGSEPVQGRLTFGLRILPNGGVEGVNLAGPRAVTSGEAGDCLRTTSRAMHFPAFDGPPMVTHYPVTLE